MQLQFLYGNKLTSKDVPIKPGTIYLDVATGELYYDDPSNANATDHTKIIDTATLIYTATESVTFPSSGSEDNSIPGIDGSGSNSGGDNGSGEDNNLSGSETAVLGIAKLGIMKLGTQ